MKYCHGAFLIVPVLILGLFAPVMVPAQETAPVQIAAYTEEAVLFREIPSVYGASKYEQKVTEAPSSVSIITSDEIKKYGYRTLADILKSVRSFYVTYDRNYSYAGVRGFGRPGDYNSRVLLLIDGHRTNDNVYNQALIGTEGIIDVDIIDRVEIIRGPGSSLYGSNAFFGVINVITRRGRNLKGAEISAAAGSFDAYSGRVSYGNRYIGGAELIASATAYDSKGDRLYFPQFDPAMPGADPRAVNGGNSNNSDYDRAQNIFSTVAFGDITFQGAYSSRTKGIPTGAFGTDFNDPQSRTIDTRSYIDLKYEHGLGARNDLTVRLYYDYYQYTGDYAYFSGGGTLNKDVTYGSWMGGEVKLVSRIGDLQRLITGAEYQGGLHEDQQNYDTGVFPYYLDDKRRSRVEALYLQDEITFSPSLILNAGVRHDHYSTFGSTTNPRLALIALPAEKSTIKLLYGSAFRAPNDFELYYQSPGFSASNPYLKPEKIKTYELVYDRYLGDRFRATVSGYYYRIRDLINYGIDPVTGLSQYQNLEEVTARGGEAEVEGKWANGLEGRVSYTLQRTKDLLTGDPITNSPGQMAKVGVIVPLLPLKVFAGIEEQYMGRRRTDGGNFASSFSVTNLTLSLRNVVPRLEVSASAYNLFNRKYGDPVSLLDLQPLDTVQQDGRNYRVKLVYTF